VSSRTFDILASFVGVLNYKWLSKPIRMIKKWHRKLRRMIIFYESWFLPVKCPRKYDENLTRSENTVSFSIGNASIFFILLIISAYYDCALDGRTFFSLLWIGVPLSNFDIVDASVDIVLEWFVLVCDL